MYRTAWIQTINCHTSHSWMFPIVRGSWTSSLLKSKMLLVFSFIKKINQMSEIFVNVNFGNVHLCWKAKKQGGKMLIHCTCIYLGYTLRHNTCSTDKNRYLVTGLLLHWTAAFPSWQSILLGTINVTGAGLKWFDRVVYCIARYKHSLTHIPFIH